jgi:hypothetical protein
MLRYPSRSNYITPVSREIAQKASECINLNPWVVQNLVYKLIQNYMLTNDPKVMGYTFDQKYDLDSSKSDIDLAISYNYKADVASKRPAVFVGRENAEIKYPTFGQSIGGNVAESENTMLGLISLPIRVFVVASPLGFAEQLADYVKQPLMYHAQTIQQDFGFMKFRLMQISKPQILVEAKDNIVVELVLQINYSDGWTVIGDHLKLKTVSGAIFDSLKAKPIENL